MQRSSALARSRAIMVAHVGRVGPTVVAVAIAAAAAGLTAVPDPLYAQQDRPRPDGDGPSIVAGPAHATSEANGDGSPADAPSRAASMADRARAWVPDIAELVDRSPIGLQAVVERYVDDRGALGRRYDAGYSASRREAFRAFHREWLDRLDGLDFDALDREARVDFLLLENEIEHALAELDREAELLAEAGPLLPFASTIHALHDARRDLQRIDPRAAARTLDDLADTIDSTRAAVERGLREDERGEDGGTDVASTSHNGGGAGANGGQDDAIRATRLVAFRTASVLGTLARTLEDWYGFHHGYDPVFTWWAERPYARVEEALEAYRTTLRRDVVGIPPDGEDPIVGEPLGRDALLADLEHEMIPYSPEELIRIARRELEWGIEEMRRAARELGYGDDWRAALEAVKQRHVPPGEQPELIRDLAREAEDYVESNGLVTVPPLAREVWRMEMMSPERQRVAPFFLGGERILVSYPTHEMTHDEKLMSMRGNNPHFSRATVHHELIPGHHLQGFMTDRHFSYRNTFGTPFWHEGNAFYWEMVLWDRGFVDTPENRIGALFWRNHRAARIIFSLSFHLGEMTPEECIELLVDQVGHERANAEAEVRRSFNGSYSPLYQVAYMMGGLQFWALREELVDSGRMTDREYHDAILRGGRMPVEMVRARLTEQSLERDHEPGWRYMAVPDGS
ncbi:MAG: DUF885 family protein [Gemmatimonadota bacterium]